MGPRTRVPAVDSDNENEQKEQEPVEFQGRMPSADPENNDEEPVREWVDPNEEIKDDPMFILNLTRERVKFEFGKSKNVWINMFIDGKSDQTVLMPALRTLFSSRMGPLGNYIAANPDYAYAASQLHRAEYSYVLDGNPFDARTKHPDKKMRGYDKWFVLLREKIKEIQQWFVEDALKDRLSKEMFGEAYVKEAREAMERRHAEAMTKLWNMVIDHVLEDKYKEEVGGDLEDEDTQRLLNTALRFCACGEDGVDDVSVDDFSEAEQAVFKAVASVIEKSRKRPKDFKPYGEILDAIENDKEPEPTDEDLREMVIKQKLVDSAEVYGKTDKVLDKTKPVVKIQGGVFRKVFGKQRPRPWETKEVVPGENPLISDIKKGEFSDVGPHFHSMHTICGPDMVPLPPEQQRFFSGDFGVAEVAPDIFVNRKDHVYQLKFHPVKFHCVKAAENDGGVTGATTTASDQTRKRFRGFTSAETSALKRRKAIKIDKSAEELRKEAADLDAKAKADYEAKKAKEATK